MVLTDGAASMATSQGVPVSQHYLSVQLLCASVAPPCPCAPATPRLHTPARPSCRPPPSRSALAPRRAREEALGWEGGGAPDLPGAMAAVMRRTMLGGSWGAFPAEGHPPPPLGVQDLLKHLRRPFLGSRKPCWGACPTSALLSYFLNSSLCRCTSARIRPCRYHRCLVTDCCCH